MKARLIALALACLGVLAADGAPLKGFVSNNKGGIGVRTDWDHKVTRVYLDSPAERAGIEVGDKIVTVDSKKHGTCRGTPGSVAHITVKRGLGVMEFEIERRAAIAISRRWKRY